MVPKLLQELIEAEFFLGALHVDFITLEVLVIGATVSKIHTATIRLIMIVTFILMILLLVGKLLEILPIGGSSVKLTGYKLILGFIGMFVAGFLVCFGVL